MFIIVLTVLNLFFHDVDFVNELNMCRLVLKLLTQIMYLPNYKVCSLNSKN